MGWQDYTALALVAAAAAYLIRGFFKKRSASAPACGSSCGGCPAPSTNEPKLVSLSPTIKSK